MLWIVLATLSVLFSATRNALCKQILKTADQYTIAGYSHLFSIPFLLTIFSIIELPALNNEFWLALAFMSCAFALATVLFLSGLEESDLSLTVPLFSFGPAITALTAPLIISEFPAIPGLSGIALIVLGSYLLSIDLRSEGLLAPFTRLARERGLRLVLGASIIWGITPSFHRIGIENSSAEFWPLALVIGQFLVMLPVIAFKSHKPLIQVRQNLRLFVWIGLCAALSLMCMVAAIDLTLVVYVIAIRRAGSTVLSVVMGHFFFEEEGVRQRLLGATVIAVGVLLVTLF